MSEEKSQVLPIGEIKNEGKLIQEIFYKPKGATVVCLLVGLCFIVTLHPAAIALGIFILAVALFVIFKIKNYKTIGVYDRYLIIYATKDQNYARRIELDEIQEWTVKSGEGISDALMLKLQDGEVLFKDTFQIGLVYKSLNKVIPEKETRKIREEANKKKKLKFSWPFKKRK